MTTISILRHKMTSKTILIILFYTLCCQSALLKIVRHEENGSVNILTAEIMIDDSIKFKLNSNDSINVDLPKGQHKFRIVSGNPYQRTSKVKWKSKYYNVNLLNSDTIAFAIEPKSRHSEYIGEWVASKAEANTKCLKYEPTMSTLFGKLYRDSFPGPPNYENYNNGDRKEIYWILSLMNPICLDSTNDLNVSEINIRQVQLLLENYENYKFLLNRTVKVTGTLSHAITGHHHTNVLINVNSISACK